MQHLVAVLPITECFWCSFPEKRRKWALQARLPTKPQLQTGNAGKIWHLCNTTANLGHHADPNSCRHWACLMWRNKKKRNQKRKRNSKKKPLKSPELRSYLGPNWSMLRGIWDVKGGMVAKSGKNKRASGASVEQKMGTESSPGEKN